MFTLLMADMYQGIDRTDYTDVTKLLRDYPEKGLSEWVQTAKPGDLFTDDSETLVVVCRREVTG